VGRLVRITTVGGDTYEGTVTETGADFVTLRLADTGDSDRSFGAKDVVRFEVRRVASPLAELGVASLVVGGLVGGYYLMNYDGGEDDIAWEAAK